MKLFEHTTRRFRPIENLTDDALATHLARTRTDDFASAERAYPEVYTARREALEAEARRRANG